ncbi:DUF3761 domain-containing protein [Gluconobacter japonicus]|uniref:DUF3761 domain-containing protein n=1 Tax=Gluconobacter japonicus TaxID=376620 RepID=UPI0009E918AF|nr:DUF3761 domain-containing protein [Gluconobacter japonicus]
MSRIGYFVNKSLYAIFIVAGLAASVPHACAFQPPQPKPQTTKPSQDVALLDGGHYTNVDGKSIHSPSHTTGNRVPAGASAKCGDGTYSFSTHHRGTCSHHGGVDEWL